MNEKELSRSATILLAFVAEKAMSAYEMVRMLQAVNAQRWLPLSESSIYATARLLEKKGLVAVETVREGNMPEKTVFTVTPEGKTRLSLTIGAFLGTIDAANPEFDMAMLFACSLPRDEVLARLGEKRDRLRSDIERTERELAALGQNARVRPIGPCMVRHNRYLKEAELRTTIELIEIVEGERDWKWFVTEDLRADAETIGSAQGSTKEKR